MRACDGDSFSRTKAAQISRATFTAAPRRKLDNRPDYVKLRVLHVVDRLGVGGTEFGVLKVIQGLSDSAFEHRVCTVRGFDELLVRAQCLEKSVYVVGRSGQGFQFLLGRFLRIMRQLRPHIVHSRNWGAIEAIPAARLARVPVAIHSEHGYEVEMLTGLPFRRRAFRRAAYALADSIFAVTEELRRYHARQAWLPAERFRVLPNGVDTSRFAPRPRERTEIRQRLGLASEGLVLGTVGRMVPIKDHTTLLQTAKILVGRGIMVQVLLAGSGPELIKHQEFVAASPSLAGRVIFTGLVANVEDVLNAMDIFVLPSISEGMSNTLLEAMASGLPVVAAKTGGNPELVEEGRSGLLFPPGGVADLVSQLEKLSSDTNLRRALGKGARSRAVRDFSLERMIGRYRDLYLELARKRGIPTVHLG
jgi:sugar transferase (PEP-CTERM/EpsH1 system associated)